MIKDHQSFFCFFVLRCLDQYDFEAYRSKLAMCITNCQLQQTFFCNKRGCVWVFRFLLESEHASCGEPSKFGVNHSVSYPTKIGLIVVLSKAG